LPAICIGCASALAICCNVLRGFIRYSYRRCKCCCWSRLL
jgi:hypothetical protein